MEARVRVEDLDKDEDEDEGEDEVRLRVRAEEGDPIGSASGNRVVLPRVDASLAGKKLRRQRRRRYERERNCWLDGD